MTASTTDNANVEVQPTTPNQDQIKAIDDKDVKAEEPVAAAAGEETLPSPQLTEEEQLEELNDFLSKQEPISGIVLRALSRDELDAIMAVVEDYAKFWDTPEMKMPKAHLEEFLGGPVRPMVDLVLIAEERDPKNVIGAIQVMLQDRTGQGNAGLTFKPSYAFPEGLDKELITKKLYSLSERLVMRKADRVPEARPITVSAGALSKDVESNRILESSGYTFVRSWYKMKIQLEGQTIEVPEFPEGLELRPYIREEHAKLVHEAQQEAFRDHSGHVEDMPFEMWESLMHSSTQHDPSLWFILWDKSQNEIAAGLLGEVTHHPDDNLRDGEAALVFTRKPWRRQGIASCLLKFSFREFQKRGLKAAQLAVDGKSKTNAVSVYENVGMSKFRERFSYRKLMRGNPEDVVD